MGLIMDHPEQSRWLSEAIHVIQDDLIYARIFCIQLFVYYDYISMVDVSIMPGQNILH